MPFQNRIVFVLLPLLALLASAARPQTPQLVNPGFEQGAPGEAPPGWFVPKPVTDAGYVVQLSDENPKAGKQCAFITLTGAPGQGFGNMMQSIDATAYRGKKIRLRAAVRYDSGSGFGRAQLWMRVDRPGGAQGFFDNMGDRPITSPTWAFYDVVGMIDADAETINVGMMLVGSGKAWIDAVSLGAPDGTEAEPAPPKALTDRGLENLVAFARLFGYIRYFHPSDAVEKADWNALALAGVPVAENASDPADLARKLGEFFRPLAPSVQLFATGSPPKAISLPPNSQMVSWEHIGLGGGLTPPDQNIYHSKRVFTGAPGSLPAPFEADLGGGISCRVPLTLFGVNNSALPHTADPVAVKPPSVTPTGDDRTTRLADIVLAWNVYEHFFPYFDVVKTDWNAVLSVGLTSAATDLDKHAFYNTLRRLVASAKDGHGGVGPVTLGGYASPPILADWIEGKLVVIQTDPGALKPRAGDEILKIDGKPVADLWKQEEPMLAGATEQWRRYRGKSQLLLGAPDSTATLDLLTGSGEFYTVALKRSAGHPLVEFRPKPIEELKPGIWYVDLDTARAKIDDYRKAIPDLAKAKGIIFDMRGYPNDVAMDALQHVSDKPITSAFWNIPRVTKPDHQGLEFEASRWPLVGPLEPRFKGKIAFVTDGRAISYAESVMGIVEFYKLGEIVGGPTAGTNGNINPIGLPGGYVFVFTGMKVVKHDGSTHHGVGIKPTIPVSRTVEGVAAHRDELLEKAIQVVGG